MKKLQIAACIMALLLLSASVVMSGIDIFKDATPEPPNVNITIPEQQPPIINYPEIIIPPQEPQPQPQTEYVAYVVIFQSVFTNQSMIQSRAFVKYTDIKEITQSEYDDADKTNHPEKLSDAFFAPLNVDRTLDGVSWQVGDLVYYEQNGAYFSAIIDVDYEYVKIKAMGNGLFEIKNRHNHFLVNGFIRIEPFTE
jgi:hypothetical protein